MSPDEFHKLCAAHDWTYQYADDPFAYRAGVESYGHIRAAIRAQPDLLPLYNRWYDWANNRGPYPTISNPKPTTNH